MQAGEKGYRVALNVLTNFCENSERALCTVQDLTKVIAAFNAFEGETSLKEQALILQEMLEDETCIAVGWNQTSVNADTWLSYNYDEELEDYVPYNCLEQNEHYWLFDELTTTE